MNRDFPGSPRLLVAEDDPVNECATRFHLARLGLGAEVVSDGEQVLKALGRQTFDLVFLDCQMPRLDGWNTARAIRRREGENNRSRTILIALSSLSSPLYRQQCLDAGMDDFLSKPIEEVELAACLAFWLRFPPRVNEALSPDLRAQLVPIFLEDAPRRIAALRAALMDQNARIVALEAHTLKSSSALLGALALSEACESLEILGEASVLDERARNVFETLETEFSRWKTEWETL